MTSASVESTSTPCTGRSALQQAWSQIDDWLAKRPKWQREALARICRDEDVQSAEGISQLSALLAEEVRAAKASDVEAKGKLPTRTPSPDTDSAIEPVVLERISGVVGVNALAPREPLILGPQLSVIYGENGSGKSGYVRLLKQFGAARAIVPIRGNIFGDPSLKPAAQIGYRVGDRNESYCWAGTDDGPAALKAIQIFDAECAQVYLSKRNELVYKPRPLDVLGRLSNLCDAVKEDLRSKYRTEGAWRDAVPAAHKAVPEIAKLLAEKTLPGDVQLQDVFTWNDAHQARLGELELLLATTSPEEESKKIGRQIERLVQLLDALKRAEELLTPSGWTELAELRRTTGEAMQAAQRDSRMAFDGSPMSEIAIASWKRLWQAAKEFSVECAYPNQEFPWTTDGAKCVLCQQPLTEAAATRLRSFEAFVVGKLATDAKIAADRLSSHETRLRELLEPSIIVGHLDGAALETALRDRVSGYVQVLSSVRNALLEGKPTATPLPDSPRQVLIAHLETLQKRKTDCELAVTTNDRAPQKLEAASLRGKQWFAGKRDDWQAWREQDRQLAQLDKLTKTTAISNLADELAKLLLTDAFVRRFAAELEVLGARHIRVALKLDQGKAKTAHQITLRGVQTNLKPTEVLSEGELRIVALAAFLTEAQFQPSTPIVLDDPVSSLDHRYEERVAERIVELAKERQVILLTHRISLTVLTDDCAERSGVPTQTVSVAREHWGTGEPECNPLHAQKTKAAVNSLCNDRLDRLRRAKATSREEYEWHAELFAKEVRKVLERIVEHDLIAGVILRFRREVNTLGKVERLSRITVEDCCVIDTMMTKYSRYEHSQSDEAPVQLPEPEEFHADLSSLQTWLVGFQKRMDN